MNAQHTPGPWSYVRNPENTRWIIDSAPAHGIACTAGHEPDNEANACLIAAAPELLSLAYQYLSDLRRPPTGESLERRIEEARRVILKALGDV